MKFAVSVAVVALLLAMPLGCILVKCQIFDAPCCPQSKASVKCPYDALDSAKAAALAVASLPPAVVTGIVSPHPPVALEPVETPPDPRRDLYILNRILRI